MFTQQPSDPADASVTQSDCTAWFLIEATSDQVLEQVGIFEARSQLRKGRREAHLPAKNLKNGRAITSFDSAAAKRTRHSGDSALPHLEEIFVN